MGWDEGHPQDALLIVISIHPPRVGWDYGDPYAPLIAKISIHPPRAGWDNVAVECHLIPRISIPPPRVGRNLKPATIIATANIISILPSYMRWDQV